MKKFDLFTLFPEGKLYLNRKEHCLSAIFFGEIKHVIVNLYGEATFEEEKIEISNLI